MPTRLGPGARQRAGLLPGSVIAVLGALSAFGPLATDMYLPGLPGMARDLHAPSSVVQLTLSVSLIGLGVGQLLAGPVSDSLGRRRPLIGGLVAFLLASVLCALAPGVAVLLAARFVQGLAGACGIVISRAVVRDRVEGRAVAKAYAALMVVNGLGPILAPVIGGLLLHLTDWRGIFAVLAGIGLVLLVAAWHLVPESLPAARRDPHGLAGVRPAMGILLADRRFVGHALAGALAFGALMSYIAASPFVLERIHGFSPSVYSVVFATNGVAILIGRRLGSSRLDHVDPSRVLGAALAVQSTASLVLLADVLGGWGVGPLLVCLFLAAGSMGAIMPTAVALAMADHPERAGSASGVIGFLQFGLGSILAPLMGVVGPLSALPMAVAMPACSLGAVVAWRRAGAAHPAGDHAG